MKTRRNLGVETMKKGALLLLALLFFVACTRKAHYIHSGGAFLGKKTSSNISQKKSAMKELTPSPKP